MSCLQGNNGISTQNVRSLLVHTVFSALFWHVREYNQTGVHIEIRESYSIKNEVFKTTHDTEFQGRGLLSVCVTETTTVLMLNLLGTAAKVRGLV
jgi:hypothetical protein